MSRYDYREAMKEDIREYLRESPEKLMESPEDLYDEMFCSDSITGNASGSYTFNSYEAEENVCHNFDLLGEAFAEFGSGPETFENFSAESADVSIRCYLLGECLSEVLEETEFEDLKMMQMEAFSEVE